MELRFQQRSVLSRRPRPFRSITLVIESPPRPLNDYPWATELYEAARSKQTPLGPLYSFLKASSHPINFKIHRHTHSHTYIIKLKRKTDTKEQTNYLLIVNRPGPSEDMVCDIHSGLCLPWEGFCEAHVLLAPSRKWRKKGVDPWAIRPGEAEGL